MAYATHERPYHGSPRHISETIKVLLGDIALRAVRFHSRRAADRSLPLEERRKALCEGLHILWQAAAAGCWRAG